MVFGCFFFGIFVNKIGVKKVFIIGIFGYVFYLVLFYVNNCYGMEWFVFFGGVICGIVVFVFWVLEGVIVFGYGDIKDWGKFIGIWFGFCEFG